MRKAMKIWLIIGASLVFLGLIVFGGVMTMLKWDFTKLSTTKYETNTHEIGEAYQSISVNTNTADFILVPSEHAERRVICHEEKNVKHSVAVKEDTLVIDAVDTRKWYEHIGISFGKPKITVYLPQGEYDALSVKSSTGDVEIPKDFNFESIDISEDTGDVTCYASVSQCIKIKTDTGNIRIENLSAGMLDLSVTTGDVKLVGVTSVGDVKISVSTGKTSATDVKCKNLISSGNTGDMSLKNVIAAEAFSIERSTGDVKLDGCDAAELRITTDTGDVKLDACDADELFIKTDTGDVTGSLLSEKVFITQTDTGRIDVPKATSGGRCEITTDTGNIKISIVTP